MPETESVAGPIVDIVADLDGFRDRPSLFFTTILGLIVGFVALWADIPFALMEWCVAHGVSARGATAVLESLVALVATALIIGIVRFIERMPLSSIGLRKPRWSDFALGLALFGVLRLTSIGTWYLLRFLAPHGMAHVAEQQLKEFSSVPFWAGIVLAVGAGVSEEITNRGFAITRLAAVTHRLILAALVALILAVFAHVPYWGWRYAFRIAPVQIVLTVAYLWRRDIMANIVAHALVDALPVLLPIIWTGGIGFFGMGNIHAVAAIDYSRQGKYEDAASEYTWALEKQPGDRNLLMARAKVQIKDSHYTAGINDLDQILLKNAKDLEALTTRAEAYADLSDYDRALVDAGCAISAAPGEPASYSKRAEIEARAEKYDVAIADLNQAFKLAEKPDVTLLWLRGRAFRHIKRCDLAVADLSRANQIYPGDRHLVSELALALVCNRQFDEAIARWSEAVKLDPEDNKALLARGSLYSHLGQYASALSDMREAADTDEVDEYAYNSLAWLLSTCPDKVIRDGKRALELANSAGQLTYWKKPEVLDTLAAAYAEAGNFPEAIGWEQRALDLGKSLSEDTQNEYRSRLALYLKGQPYREPPKFAKAS